MNDKADMLRVGDIVEFHRSGNPQPRPEWHAQRVTQIRIVEEFDDKEGIRVEQVSWHAIRNYVCMVVILGTEDWARNDQIRPRRKLKRAGIVALKPPTVTK